MQTKRAVSVAAIDRSDVEMDGDEGQDAGNTQVRDMARHMRPFQRLIGQDRSASPDESKPVAGRAVSVRKQATTKLKMGEKKEVPAASRALEGSKGRCEQKKSSAKSRGQTSAADSSQGTAS